MKRDPRKAFEQKLVELGGANDRILALSCDSASGGGLGEFFKRFPGRSIEIGIAEQNGVSIAASLTKQGFIPVLVIINPFLTMRAYEQIRDDLGYMDTNVKIVGSGGGLAYSTLGSSHIAIEDIALMRTIPNLTIFVPGTADEVEFCLEEAMKIYGPVYIRMPRQSREDRISRDKRSIVYGKAEVIAHGSDTILFACGPSIEEALKAADILSERGLSVTVVNMITLSPFDEETVLNCSRKAKAIFTLEEHISIGGLGSAVAEVMARNGLGVPLDIIALDKGSKMTGPYDELLEHYGLSGEKVADRIQRTIKNRIY